MPESVTAALAPEHWQPPVNGANRYAHVDALRAFAIMVVVVAHAGLDNIVPGGSGVTIFFAVSGFIITHLVIRELRRTDGFSASQFYIRRALKILPPFLLAVIVPTVLYGIRYHVSTGDVLTQVFFVFNWIAYRAPDVLPGTGVMWSLAIEEQFYIVFAVLWAIALRTGRLRPVMIWSSIVAIAVATVARLVLTTDSHGLDETPRIFFGTDTRLDAIALGVLTAFVYDAWSHGAGRPAVRRFVARDVTLVAAVAVYLITLAIRNVWFRDTFRYSLQALASCAVVLYGLLPGDGPLRAWFYRVATNRVVSLIGLASYSIYLVHETLGLWIADSVLDGASRAIRTPLVSAAGVGAGLLLYRVVEIPAQRFGRRLRRPESTRERGVHAATATPTGG